MNIIPIFRSTYSIGRSILTLDSEGSSKPNYPQSIIDLCKAGGIKDCFLIEDNYSSFPEAYSNCKKAGLNLRYGIRFTVCDDINKKDEESLVNEHRVIILAKNSKGEKQLEKIWSKAATTGFYYNARLDYNSIKELWTDDLQILMPFYDSFIHRNLLYFSTIVPLFEFTKPYFCVEKGHELPFDHLIENAVLDYCSKYNHKILNTFTIYYPDIQRFKAFTVRKCVDSRTTISRPQLDHYSSDKFGFDTWKALNV